MPGVRQRLGIDADAAASGASSSTGDYFRGMYASARLSAAEVSQGASAIVSDLGGSSDVRQLGSANPTKKRRLKDGSEKLDTRNVSRDVRRAFARHRSERSKLPVPIDIEIPLWSKKGVSELKAVSFLLPHLLLDSIPEGEEEDSCFLAPEQVVVRRDLEAWKNRLDLGDEGPPIASCSLWGDGAPFALRDSVQLLILSLISGTEAVRWWVCAFSKTAYCRCGCKGRHTFDAIFEVLAWSFRAAAAGVHPRHDHKNALLDPRSKLGKLAGRKMRIRGALLSKQGDWSWYKQVLGLNGWKGEGPSKRVCWICPATIGGACPCWDFTADALWRRTKITSGEYFDHAARHGHFVSTFWQIPGVTLSTIKIDWMHVVCLGIMQYASGSTMWELFQSLGGTFKKPVDACGKLMSMIEVKSKELNVDLPLYDLSVTMFRKGASKKPKLSLKAAEGRHFLRILHGILRDYFPHDDHHARARFALIDSLFSCYMELDNWIPGGTSKDNLARLGKRHLLLCVDLAEHNDTWNLFPKHHLFGHIVTDADENPKTTWNYALESEIGDASVVAANSSKPHLQRALIQRYVVTK